jgi:hypothetical protein
LAEAFSARRHTPVRQIIFGVIVRESERSSIPEASQLKHNCLWNTGLSGPDAQLRKRPDDDSGEDVKQHSRGAISPELCIIVVPHQNRGRRECRAPAAPAASYAN